MIFDGIEPWPELEPVVEVRVRKRLIDLHNWASFVGFDYRYPETLVFRFEYDETWGGAQDGASGKEIGVRFDGVANLRTDTDTMEHVYEGDTLSEFLYRPLRPGRGWIQATMMDGFTIRFEAGSVSLEEEE